MKGADKAGLETWERKNRPIKKDTCWSCCRALYFPLSVFLFVFVKKDGSEYHACHSERSRQAPPCQGGGTASILLLPVSNSLQTLTRAPQCHCPCLCILAYLYLCCEILQIPSLPFNPLVTLLKLSRAHLVFVLHVFWCICCAFFFCVYYLYLQFASK